MQPSAHGRDGDAKLTQDLRRHALFLLEEGHQDMLGIPLAVAVSSNDLLGHAQDFLGLLGKLIWLQNHIPVP